MFQFPYTVFNYKNLKGRSCTFCEILFTFCKKIYFLVLSNLIYLFISEEGLGGVKVFNYLKMPREA